MNRKAWIILIVVIGLLILCCCASSLTLGGAKILQYGLQLSGGMDIPGYVHFPQDTPDIIWETSTALASPSPVNTEIVETVMPTLAVTTQVVETVVPTLAATTQVVENDMLLVLASVEIPINDPIDLAYRLEGKTGIEEVIEKPFIPDQLGQRNAFWVSNSDTDKNIQVWATLQAITAHAYFWIGEGIRFDQADLDELAIIFEEHIYPTNRDFFGSEWTPGVDQDPHIYILFTKGIGSFVAGYFSSVDELPLEVHEYSNGHEIFILNANYLGVGDKETLGVLAHEFQHMIHWRVDKNEDGWLNEGFSELAVFINGYYENGFDQTYTANPDIQLNDWPNDEFSTTPHYGSGFLFTLYFLDQFGEGPTQALVEHEKNGLESVDAVLLEHGLDDGTTGKPLTAEDVFSDWVIANFLNDPSLGDGQYGYELYPDLPKPDETEKIRQCPVDWESREVAQFGVDYILLDCRGNYTVEIQGLPETRLLPEDPHSGKFAFWSNQGDESDMTLTRVFDFGSVEGEILFNYWVWYDLEKDYDYLYLLVSEDGEQWEILQTPLSTLDDPTGNSYGWAYNGSSGKWIEEQVDLSRFAGKRIYLRFEYVTDAAVNGEGFLIDDLSIPAIDYETGFEEGDGGWVAKGFVRVANNLPQTYAISLIHLSGINQVEEIDFNPETNNTIPVQIQSGEKIVLVISGTTRFTSQPAYYRFRVTTR